MTGAAERATAGPPRGREAVRRALLDAAAELFASRGVGAVSVRDVATAAGVNHGLVHRHFGSKDGLVYAVTQDLTQRMAAEAAREGKVTARALDATGMRAYFRLLARSLLDGVPIEKLQSAFPVVDRLRRELSDGQARGEVRGDVDAGVLTALGVAAGLGWLLFEPFVVAALGRERESLQKDALATWRRLTAPPPSTAEGRERAR